MKRFIVTIILLLSAAIANYAFSRPEAEIPRRALKEFPKVIGEWQAVNEQMIDARSMAVLLVDDYILRTYVNSKGEAAGLYIGYFKTQKEGKQVHSPRQCLPGAGWSIAASKVYSLELKNHNPARASINYYRMQHGDRQQLYLWWYQGRGRMYANEYLNKLLLIWDSISMRRTDGALVRVNMAIKDDIDHSLKTQTEFINLFAPLLSEYIPD
jgi:EpsI family protein